MVPNIFVSSTIEDLQHLREAIRDTIQELGYNPVMSEFGDVGYVPTTSAEDACYQTVKQCQLAVLIVGKRCGSVSANRLSITHNEFLAARDQKVPVYCLVEKEVLSFKRVYDANPESESSFPGMENPKQTFALLTTIQNAPANNAILPFSSVTDARELLRKQLALLFGELLAKQVEPIKEEVKDVLSEIRTLRHELLRERGVEHLDYLHAMRFLLEDKRDPYRDFVERLCGDLAQALPLLLKSETFESFLREVGATVETREMPGSLGTPGEMEEALLTEDCLLISWRLARTAAAGQPAPTAFWAIYEGRRVVINSEGMRLLGEAHENLRQAVSNSGTPPASAQ